MRRTFARGTFARGDLYGHRTIRSKSSASVSSSLCIRQLEIAAICDRVDQRLLEHTDEVLALDLVQVTENLRVLHEK